MGRRKPLGLFEAYGIELEYMIVDRETLAVRPIADRVLSAIAGRAVNEVETGALAWSNELVLHVIELKTNGPVAALGGIESAFLEDVGRINDLLVPSNCMLLPTGMHPLMDPARETKLWPHAARSIYRSYDRIFGCRAHGWANVQSVHLNLPFANDAEFGRLHAAIRLLLPILPALAASSPLLEARLTGSCDNRLDVYATNQQRIPSITGPIVPEAVYTRDDYERQILEPIYRDIAPYDTKGILQNEWLNSRGAIARFHRRTIEIRVIDVQESPRVDLAIIAATVAVLRALLGGSFARCEEQKAFETDALRRILLRTIRDAEQTPIDEADYLRLFRFPGDTCRAGELWRHLLAQSAVSFPDVEPYLSVLNTLLEKGCLARRIVGALGGDDSRDNIVSIYRALATCLAEGRLFAP
jgi:gamma-glutamyl:cysteine ligase YbdK (ATP-grasp superfamily)